MEHLDELPILPKTVSELRNPEAADLGGGPSDWYEAAKGWRQAYLEATERYNDAADRYNELLLEYRCYVQANPQRFGVPAPQPWRTRLEGLGERFRNLRRRARHTAALGWLEACEFLRGVHGPAKSR